MNKQAQTVQKIMKMSLKQNQEFIQKQIESSRQKRLQEQQQLKIFQKPHFGPEDTPEKVNQMLLESTNKKNATYRSLRD